MITAIIGVVGTLAGGILGFWGAVKAAHSQHFFASGTNLKHAFLDVLVLLRQPSETFIDLYVIEIMEKSFFKHEMAVVEFRYSLPVYERNNFDNAWRKYYESDGEGNHSLTKKYFGRPNWQEDALSNIEGILKFTECTAFLIRNRKIT